MLGSPSYTHDVFISYSTKNRPWVKSVLVPRVEAAGLRVLIDYRDFNIGRSIVANIEEAIDNCRYTVLVITPAWIDGDWTSLEQLMLSSRDPAGRQQRMIQLVVEPCTLPRQLAIFTYADLTATNEADRDTELSRVIRALKSRCRVFLACSPDAPTDCTLKHAIAKALIKNGHDLHSSETLPMGMSRRDALRSALAGCNFMVALFSTDSVADERFLADVAEARSNPNLTVLPIRVNYLDALPEQVRDLIDSTWGSPEDDTYLIRRILEALRHRPASAAEDDDSVPRSPSTKTPQHNHRPVSPRVSDATGALRDTRSRRHATSGAKLWKPGGTITIGFLEGDPAVQWRVAKAASEWARHANLRFVFTEQADALVRIGFRPDSGSWAYTALDTLTVPKNEPTANFGWLDKNTPDEELRYVVMHEFGHVLGLVHEHQVASAVIPWNREAVIRDYAGPPNYWTLQQIETTLFERYPEDFFPFPKPFDPRSIMMFPIPAAHTDGHLEIGQNVTLSDGDKEFVARLYP